MNIIETVRDGDLEETKRLIASGADINTKDIHGNTLLIWAAKEKRDGIVKFLIDSGAEIMTANNFGATALTVMADRIKAVLVTTKENT